MKNASPCVSTSTPPCAAAASRTILSVLGERVGVPRRPELVQQARRALDVGEQQRHRPLRKLPHGSNDDYAGAGPNQRARRVAPKSAFSAASSSDGPTMVATGDGPPRKLAWIFATRPLPNSMKQLPSPS